MIEPGDTSRVFIAACQKCPLLLAYCSAGEISLTGPGASMY